MKLELKKTPLLNLSEDKTLVPAELTEQVAGGGPGLSYDPNTCYSISCVDCYTFHHGGCHEV